VRARLGRGLDPFTTRIERGTVRFEDVNGPKGGIDTVCRIWRRSTTPRRRRRARPAPAVAPGAPPLLDTSPPPLAAPPSPGVLDPPWPVHDDVVTVPSAQPARTLAAITMRG